MGDMHVTCPKCGSAMDRGYMPDTTHGAATVQASWTPGEPEQIRFLGIDGGIRKKPDESIRVVAYRCIKCAFVELYAPVV